MKITIISIGKTKKGPISDLLDEYLKRLKSYIKVEWIEIPDAKNRGKLSEANLKKQEAQLFLNSLDKQSPCFLLDEGGKHFTSVEFSKFFEKHQNQGQKNVSILIGGAYGFDQEIYNLATGKISMSKMTFSHQMIRPILAEQIYRSYTILKGEPYHHQ